MFAGILVVSICTQITNRLTNSGTAATIRTRSDAIKNTSTCSMTTRDKLINLRLSVTLYDKIDVSEFEQSGCFVIDTSQSGLYRIIHEGNFANTVCAPTQKRFLSIQENEEYVSSLSIYTPYREYIHSVVVYQKYLTRLGELIIFESWRKNYHFFQPN